MNLDGVIQIKKAIVHIINKTEKKLILSNGEIELDEKINALIINHLSNTFQKDNRVFARFNEDDEAENIVKGKCLEIFKNDNTFINATKSISRKLYDAMIGTNASSANLLIAYYTHGNTKSIAIIKIDFNDSFHTEEILQEDGTTKVIVKSFISGFSKNQKLRKCAIIEENIAELNSSFLLLDTQDSDVSNFFKIGFLDSILINDSKTNTTKMVKKLNAFINENNKNNDEKLISETYKFTSILSSIEKFELDSVLNQLGFEEKQQTEFRKKIASEDIDFTFIPHKETIERILNNKKIVTDNGISLTARADMYDNDIQIIPHGDDGISDILIKGVRIYKNKLL